MAGIEKICEFKKDFSCYPDCEDRKYEDNLQICEKHKKEFSEICKGRRHEIVIEKSDLYTYQDHWDFYIWIEGFDCDYNGRDKTWMRWFDDKKQWEKNIKKLLGVRKLNIVKQFSNTNPHPL